MKIPKKITAFEGIGVQGWTVPEVVGLLDGKFGPSKVDDEPANNKPGYRCNLVGVCVHRAINRLARSKSTIGHKMLRHKEAVHAYYESAFKKHTVDSYLNSIDRVHDNRSWHRLGEHSRIETSSIAMAYLHAKKLIEVLGALNPKSVCEVGCGAGRILFPIAAHLPSIQSSGVELSSSAVELSRQLKEMALEQSTYGRVFEIDREALPAIRSTKVIQGSAFELPFADKSIDVLYTHFALEQMRDGWRKAVSEMTRVAKHAVVLCEPFSDVNDVWEYMELFSRDYFRSSISDVTSFGLEPVGFFPSIPSKLTFSTGILVAKPVSRT